MTNSSKNWLLCCVKTIYHKNRCLEKQILFFAKARLFNADLDKLEAEEERKQELASGFAGDTFEVD